MRQGEALSATPHFKDLFIRGFRRLYDVHLDLRSLAVMIGANGTGKTSVLDVLSLLANSAQGTGTNDFHDAADAKAKLSQWVGANPLFYPHTAQYDFEAWLLPYWNEIQRLAGHNRNPPAGLPETVNHTHPPSYRIQEIFRAGKCRDDYSKPRDANRILRNKDLGVAASQCPELRAFLNTIITLSGGTPI